MDNIRATLDTLFSQINNSTILSELLNKGRHSETLGVTEEMFCQKFMVENKCYTCEQVHELYYLVTSQWMKNPLLHLRQTNNEKELFYTLLHYSTEILSIQNDKPVCKYNQLLRWRTLVHGLGEDLFTTSFLAFKDIQQRSERKYFYWSPVIAQDNPAIDYMLRKGVTDLHFHLRGSSLNYELNWISLMNNIQNRKKDFEQLKKCLSHKFSTIDKERWDSFYLSTLKACSIRYFLFLILMDAGKADSFKKILYQLLGCSNDALIQQPHKQYVNADSNEIEMSALQQYINNAKYTYGYKKQIKGSIRCLDYAIPTNYMHGIHLAEILLSGERRFLYGMFHRIYTHTSTYEEKVLFYIYLLQKGQIRKELVQLNEFKGFGNFADYECRKELFIENRPEYQEAIPKLAIDMAFAKGNLKYLECRITPKETSEKLLHSINNLEKQIKAQWPLAENTLSEANLENKYFYILHFIKKKDEHEIFSKAFDNAFINYRHFKLRHDIRQQGCATLEALKKYPKLRKRIIGIDAANSELYCRPEVFGPIYRYIKHFCNSNNYYYNGHSLNFTYHIGEDFWDITDGLRAIDEAIIFLNLDANDRLGHALALGTNVKAYYRFRNFRVVMSKQNLMDNIMWLLHKAKELDIPLSVNLSAHLQNIFSDIYDETYCTVKIENKNIKTYYQSWLLRGDDPELYKNLTQVKRLIEKNQYHSLWEITALNLRDVNIVNARKHEPARLLYHAYHYNPSIRRIGNERYELKLTPEIISLIEQVQHKMCYQIASLHLGIEANITSNQFIGSMNKYMQHPIVKLYQLGLPIKNGSDNCPQMSISINTDDRGIFDTSIEEEYALLALALEKEVDENNQPRYQPRYIYEWLNNIRKMGFEQQFKKQNASKY